jgi:branched-subunit amino acid transport protein
MSEADFALAATIAIGLALRLVGLLLGGALHPDNAFIAWASAVSVATLACFVALAIFAPAGLLASVPLAARLAGLAGGGLVYLAAGRRLLPAMLAGLGALLLARLVTG